MAQQPQQGEDRPANRGPSGRRIVIVGLVVLGLGLVTGGTVAALTSGSSKQAHKARATTTTTTLPPTTAPSSTTSSTSSTSSSTSSTTSSTTSTRPRPAINSFTVPATRPCPGSTTVTVSWSTKNATGVVLSIDGPGSDKNYGPAGTEAVPFNCDGNTHTYTLTTLNGTPPATTTRTVSPS